MDFALRKWAKALNGIPEEALKKAIAYCELTFEWPPSIAEFISICEKQMGVPTMSDVYALALRREFSHPLVQMVFDKIGDWSFKNDAEKELRKKVETHYRECLINLRVERANG